MKKTSKNLCLLLKIKPLINLLTLESSKMTDPISINKLQSPNENLTCSLILQKRIPKFQICCQLYVGNLKQINYILQQLTKNEAPRVIEVNKQLGQLQVQQKKDKPKNQTQSDDRHSIISKEANKMYLQQQRKLKTQAQGVQEAHRQPTQQKVSGQSMAIDKFQMQEGNHSEHNAQEQQNIYIVDLLTRFLDAMPTFSMPQNDISKSQLIKMFQSEPKNSYFQLQLLQIITSIFQDDPNSNDVKLNQLQACIKAYNIFHEMYKKQLLDYLNQILNEEPKASLRIKNNAEMGTINESLLWGRALNKIKNSHLKRKINKFYKISSFGSTDIALLIEDLQNPNRKQLRPLDIGNLSMLIKQWVQQFIIDVNLQHLVNFKERLLKFGEEDILVNIRSISQIIEASMQLRLSLWESIMLIQEIKGSYGCDIQLEQGVISAVSIINWIDSIRGRLNKKTQQSEISQSRASFDPQQLALIQHINQKNQPKDKIIKQKEVMKENQSIKVSKRNRIDTSSYAPPNNDSQILDIANLLRQKDGMLPFELIQQSKTKNMHEKKLRQDNKPIAHKPNKIKQYEQDSDISQRDIQINYALIQKNLEVKQKHAIRDYFIQIRQLKFYDLTFKPKLLKLTITLQNKDNRKNQQYFYYITLQNSYSEINNKILKFINNLQSHHYEYKNLKININDENDKILLKGILAIEEINDWLNNKDNKQCKKIIVLYQGIGNIGGKIILNLLKEEREALLTNKDHIGANQNNTLFISVHNIIPKLMIGQKLYVMADGSGKKQIILNQEIRLEMNMPIYHCEVRITNDQQTLSSVISLEQVYLRHFVEAQYPLINIEEGKFIATLNITLRYNHDLKPFKKKQQSILQKGQVSDFHATSKFIYLFTEMCTYGYKFSNDFSAKLHCYLYSNQPNIPSSEKLTLVTPSINFKVRQFPTIVKLTNQKIQINNENQFTSIQLKLIQNGRILCTSDKLQINKLKSSLYTNYISMHTHNDEKAIFTFAFKKIKIEQEKYSLRRIMACLSQLPYYIPSKNMDKITKDLKHNNHLTITQYHLFKQICQNHLKLGQEYNCILYGGQIVKIDLKSFNFEEKMTDSMITTFMQEIIFINTKNTKSLSDLLLIKQFKKMIKILSQSYSNEILSKIAMALNSISTLNDEQIVQIPYLWVTAIFLNNFEHTTLQITQKRSLLSNIDSIYESLKLKYG